MCHLHGWLIAIVHQPEEGFITLPADDGELDHHPPRETSLVRDVRLERDSVDDLAAEPELASGLNVLRGQRAMRIGALASLAPSVQDAAAMVRDYTKWDDTPASLRHFGESAVRAYKIAMTPPYGPVVIVADTELQERPVSEGSGLRVPKLTLTSPPQGDSGAVSELARLLALLAHHRVISRDCDTPGVVTAILQ